MDTLEREVDAPTGRAIMDRCACIGAGVIAKAQALQREAQDLDDLLARMNAAHLGGGHLRRESTPEGDVIHASYDRCYCGSVSKSREPVSATYCACSCGWYRRLFEALLDRPVEVALLSSILQGDDQCRFLIRAPGPAPA
jgi:predicted hydrocarbon binding protein